MTDISRLCRKLPVGTRVVTLDKEMTNVVKSPRARMDKEEEEEDGVYIITCRVEVVGSWGRAKGIVHEKVEWGEVEKRILESKSTNQVPLGGGVNDIIGM